eukprot:529790-Alexandrium_andersonii.AAC.1
MRTCARRRISGGAGGELRQRFVATATWLQVARVLGILGRVGIKTTSSGRFAPARSQTDVIQTIQQVSTS